MKTPEEIKKALECCARIAGCGDCPYRGEKCALMVSVDTLEYIRQLEEGIDLVYEQAKSLRQQVEDYVRKVKRTVPKWISVEERLPNDNEDVLVFAVGKDEPVIAMTNYTHNMYGLGVKGWRSPWDYFHHNYTVTHWMPLPEGPEED